jgi:hypothetical protein
VVVVVVTRPIIVIIIMGKSIIVHDADEVGRIICHARSDILRRLRVRRKAASLFTAEAMRAALPSTWTQA